MPIPTIAHENRTKPAANGQIEPVTLNRLVPEIG
jgi:hypothetical protein